LNILLFNTYASSGGAARACHRLHEGLRGAGHASTLAVCHDDGISRPGVRVCDRARPAVRASHAEVLARIRGEALTEPASTYFSLPAPSARLRGSDFLDGIDAVNIHWVADYLSPGDLQTLFSRGQPVVWTLHDARPFTGGCHYPGDCRAFLSECAGCPQVRPAFHPLAVAGLQVQRAILGGGAAPAFVTPSAWLARLAASSPLLAGARIEVIPNSLDLRTFRPHSDHGLRRRMGWADDALVVLFGAHSIVDKRKGVDLVLEAVAHCARHADVAALLERRQLVFACFGEARGLPSGSELPVIHLGSFNGDEDAARIYQSADLFICASREDNLPNTVMEAMACGLAVLGTKVGGIPEMVDDGSTGRLVPGGDAASLSAALLGLVRDKAAIRRMGAMARRTCEERCAPSRQAGAYVSLFESMAQRGRRETRRGAAAARFRSVLAEARARRALRHCGLAQYRAPSVIRPLASRALRAAAKMIRAGAKPRSPEPAPSLAVLREGSDIRDASAIVTALEINSSHGTGVLLRRLFGGDPALLHLRCTDFYDGTSAGTLRLRIPEGVEAEQVLPSVLGTTTVERLLVVPWHQQDAVNALALRKLQRARMCVWVMDHNLGPGPGSVSAENMAKLVAAADLLLAISPELADHCSAEFGKRFHFAPPVVEKALALTAAIPPRDRGKAADRRGVLVGNIWSTRWLEMFRSVLESTRLPLEAFGGSSSPHPGGTSLEGLVSQHGYVPEAELVRCLRGAAYAVIPGGTMDENDDLVSVSRFSLPSRLIYLSAVGNLPLLYLGSPDTAAARFIRRHDLGVACPYDPGRVAETVEWICRPEQQERFRNAAARAAGLYAADDMAEWIWRSVAGGAPADRRWETAAEGAMVPR
jgi:glycosyltransferase involved in cell wall biosynthesis